MGVATATTHSLLNLGCGRESAAAEDPAPEETTGAEVAKARTPYASLAKVAAECVGAGELCVSHCLQMLASGSTEMAECAHAAREMVAVCRAMLTLAANASPHIATLAEACNQVCAACVAACRPHAGHHETCSQCKQACSRMQAAVAVLQVSAG